MKQLIKELTYRTIYTTIALSTIMGFIYLNYACQMEYVWSVYHMDSECIDFCWLESINQGQKNQLIFHSPQGIHPLCKAFCGQPGPPAYVLSGSGSVLNVIHGVLNQQSVHGILTKHSIAQNHGLFLTLVSVFIEHDSHVCLSPGHMAMLLFPPFITIVLFQNIQFWLPAMLSSSRCNIQSKLCCVFFILWVHQITLPNVIMLHKEFQMEPSDSELFASGLYTGHVYLAKVYFVWLISLCTLGPLVFRVKFSQR